MTSARYRVLRDHAASHLDPIVLAKGERVVFERRRTEWEGWIWCVSDTARSGWVPEAWVRIEGPTCVALRDYDARELTVRAGEDVEGLEEVAEWMWVRGASGEEGWVPLESLERGPA